MKSALNIRFLESDDKITYGIIHKRSHSICNGKANKNLFKVLDTVKISSVKGSRSQSLDRKEKDRRISNNCNTMVGHSNEASTTSSGNDFMNRRFSRWDKNRKFQNRTKIVDIKSSSTNTNDNRERQLCQNRGNENASLEESRIWKADLKTLLTMFLKRSSIYPLNQVRNSSTTRRKIFWAFILVLGLIGSSYQIVDYLLAYFSYPVVVNIDITSTLNNDFPAVTVCNINNVRREYLSCLRNRIEHNKCHPDVNDSYLYDDDENYLNLSFTEDLNEISCDMNLENFSQNALEVFLWQSLFLVLETDSQTKYGHQKTDLIRNCSFNGEICTLDNFTSFVNIAYGNCFTFNAANESRPPLKTSYVGPNSGLELELNIEVEKYAYFTSSVGARVEIHDPYHIPNIAEDGFNVSPGFETSIVLSKIQMLRLKAPYKDQCKDYALGESMKTCQIKCFNEYFSNNCSCTPYSYALNLTDIRHCDFSRKSDFCCFYGQYGKIECSCPLSCEDIDYLADMFSAVWPSNTYYDAHPIGDKFFDVNVVRETMLKLKVYYDTLEVITYRQKAMYQSSELFSQIGGQMGLWLGLSLVAIFECIENFILIWKYRERQNKT